MARASTYTALPLDEWARIMGMSLWHFNGIKFDEICGTQTPCTGIWYQHPWHGPRLSREDLAIAIQTAEGLISDFVGYSLLPTYFREFVSPPRHYDPLYKTSINARGAAKSVQLKKGYVVQGGTRAKSKIGTYEVIRRDGDGDGFAETAQITVPFNYPIDELRVYYPGEGGLDAWEIRPVQFKSYSTPYVIEFPIYQIVEKVYTEGLCHDDDALHATDNSIYLEEVDVYRVYTKTDVQARLIYNPSYGCGANCKETYVETCISIEDRMNGFVVYNPNLYREPDEVEVFYKAGWRDMSTQRPDVDLDPYWRTAVAYLAAGLLDREVECCGGKQSDTLSRWRDELDNTSRDVPNFVVTGMILENLFGISTRGAWFAYNRAKSRRLK